MVRLATYRLLGLLVCLTLGQLALAQQYSPGLDKGISEYEEGKYVDALSSLLEFLDKQDSTDAETAIANRYVGEVFAGSGLHDKAIEYLEAASSQTDPGTDQDRTLTELIGDQYLRLRKPAEARKYYNSLVAKSSGQIDKQAQAYQKIADSYRSDPGRQLDSVLFYNEKILSLSKSNNNPSLQIKAYNNLGYHYHARQDYVQSIKQFESALTLAEASNDPVLIGQIMLNQAIVLNNKQQQPRAIRKLKSARPYLLGTDDQEQTINYYNLISGFYLKNKDLYQAEIYNDSAIAAAKFQGDDENLASAYRITSAIKNQYRDYRAENEFAKRASRMQDSIDYRKSEKAREDLLDAFELERKLSKERMRQKDEELADERAAKAEALATSLEKDKQLALQLAENAQKDKLLAVEAAQRAKKEREVALKEIELQKEKQKVEEQVYKRNVLERENQIERMRGDQAVKAQLLEQARADKAVQDKQLEESKREKLLGFSALLGLILLLALVLLLFIRRANRKLKVQNEEIRKNRQLIAAEKEKSEALLLNILPEETAEELKAHGSATPKYYKQTSVLFTDFQGFTSIAERFSPAQLVDELNGFFKEFDEISARHNLEKIKTIGDAYMCAGGIPQPNETNAADCVAAGMEILAYVNEMNRKKEIKGERPWNIRIGIHTGPVVAGVVGTKKFAYDIWGDAVNVASRMESSGASGRINISESTYQLVRDSFACTYRGEIEAKNKGAIRMYFVEGLAEAATG